MKEQESILNDQVGGTLVDKNEQLIETEIIEGTPFALITIKDRGSFIALGRGRITDYYDSKEEAKDQINVNDWYFLLSVIYCMLKESPDFEQFMEEK